MVDLSDFRYVKWDKLPPPPSESRAESSGAGAEARLVDREDAKKHIAFGAGEHLCLGNRLGHLQIRVLYEELLARFPNIEAISEPTRIPSNFLNGISHLKVRI